MQFLSLLVGASALLTPVLAQTWTTCNPLNTTCPPDLALGLNHTFVFNTSTTVTDSFNITAGSLTYGTNGAEFTINKKGDSPTIQSQFYIFFGSVSVVMQAATGQGVISSIVLESDDLDEVDWEFMGGNGTHAETNYFGKGNTTSFDRAIYYPTGTDPRANFHNYTVHWTSAQIEWYIDSALVRTLPYAAANGGDNFPQTPMTVRMGIWAGGDPDNSNGTIQWAGGLTDFSKGPYTMYVQSATINDFSTGKEYEYSDHSGSWQSIKTIAGNSTVATAILNPPTPAPSVAQKFNNLSSGTKLAIYCAGGGAAAILLSALIFTCVRQRRAGRRERDAYNAMVEKQRDDAYKEQMELREKGLGGWDNGSFATQGEDALGGWGGSHVAASDAPPIPKMPGNVMANEVPSRSMSPSVPPSRLMSPQPQEPAIPRMMSPQPTLIAPQPQSPRAWSGGNQGGMIHNAGNAYSGGFGGNPIGGAYGGNQTGGYGGSPNIPRSPSFPLSPQEPPQSQRGYGGYSQGGYQRF